MQTLLKISADPSGEMQQIAFSAAIQLKGMTERHWRYKTEEQAKKISLEGFEWIIIPEEDKAMVRDNILEAMFNSPDKKIVKQYTACITNIARFDHPEKWTGLVGQIAQYL